MFKNLIHDKKAIFFDLDGTVIDTEPLWVEAFQAVLTAVDTRASIEKIYGIPGEPLATRWERYFHYYGNPGNKTIKELVELTNTAYINALSKVKLNPREGFWELILELKEKFGLKTALVTNSVKEVAEQTVHNADISKAFDLMVFGDQVKNPKPNPEVYLKAAKEIRVKPKEVLVFEDSVAGATAADKAGMSIIVVWDGYIKENRFPEKTQLFIPDFLGLVGNLELTGPESIEAYVKAKKESVKKRPIKK